MAAIHLIRQQKSRLVEKKPAAEVEANIRVLESFLVFYVRTLPDNEENRTSRLKKFTGMFWLIADPTMQAWDKRQILGRIFWQPNQDPALLEKIITDAWKVLEIKEALPVPRPRSDQSTSPGVSSAAGPAVKCEKPLNAPVTH